MSFISGIDLGSFVGVSWPIAQRGTSQLDRARQRRLAASFLVRREREEAKKGGAAAWARYLQKKSQRMRRYNLSTRMTPIERDKRLKRFRRTVARRDVVPSCLRCNKLLQNWRPNKEFCNRECRDVWRRSLNRWKKRQLEMGAMENLQNARLKGEDITELVKRLGGLKKIDRLYARREEDDDFQN